LSLFSLQSSSFVHKAFQKPAFLNVQGTSKLLRLRRMAFRIHQLRGCVLKLRSMMRARCLWLRPGILAERVARERGSARSAYLDVCALVSEEPSTCRHHCQIS
jgi:hypothetical protein